MMKYGTIKLCSEKGIMTFCLIITTAMCAGGVIGDCTVIYRIKAFECV